MSHGEASASAKPDQVRIQIGVVTQAPTASEAGAQNAKQSSAVISDLKQQAGPSAQIQTSNYSIYPMYRTRVQAANLPSRDIRRTIRWRSSSTTWAMQAR